MFPTPEYNSFYVRRLVPKNFENFPIGSTVVDVVYNFFGLLYAWNNFAMLYVLGLVACNIICSGEMEDV